MTLRFISRLVPFLCVVISCGAGAAESSARPFRMIIEDKNRNVVDQYDAQKISLKVVSSGDADFAVPPFSPARYAGPNRMIEIEGVSGRLLGFGRTRSYHAGFYRLAFSDCVACEISDIDESEFQTFDADQDPGVKYSRNLFKSWAAVHAAQKEGKIKSVTLMKYRVNIVCGEFRLDCGTRENTLLKEVVLQDGTKITAPENLDLYTALNARLGTAPAEAEASAAEADSAEIRH